MIITIIEVTRVLIIGIVCGCFPFLAVLLNNHLISAYIVFCIWIITVVTLVIIREQELRFLKRLAHYCYE